MTTTSQQHPDPILAWMLRLFSAAIMLFLVSTIVPIGFFIAMRTLQDYYGDQPVIVRVGTEVRDGR